MDFHISPGRIPIYKKYELERYLAANELVLKTRVHVHPRLMTEPDYFNKVQREVVLKMSDHMIPKLSWSVMEDMHMGGQLVSSELITLTQKDLIKLLSNFGVDIIE